MDPITVILGALTAAAAKVADQAVGDGYAALRDLIRRKFGAANPKLDERIEDYTEDPDTFEKPAAKALRDAGADRDEEVVEAAKALLRQADPNHPAIQGGLVGTINAHNAAVIGGSVETFNQGRD